MKLLIVTESAMEVVPDSWGIAEYDAIAERTRRSVLAALADLPPTEQRNDHIKALRRMRRPRR